MRFNHLVFTTALVSVLSANLSRAETPPLKNPFGQRFLQTMEFIDFPDVLVAIVAKNATPWTRYDNSEGARKVALETRWVNASNVKIKAGTSISDQMMLIHDQFMDGVHTEFRGTPIDDAGGDVDGFDRVSNEAADALKANPLLALEVKPDGVSKTTKLIRYAYPSAKTFEKFSKLLSPALLAEIVAAKKANPAEWVYERFDYKISLGGANPAFCPKHPNFCRLTRAIIKELLDKYSFKATDSPAANVQRMISTHPFDDYNGRTMRIWFKLNAKRPMFLLDNYCDLYCSPAKFNAAVAEGNAQYDLLVKGLQKKEAQNPGFPDFYGAPEFWQVAAGKLTSPDKFPLDVFARDAFAHFDRNEVKQAIDKKFFAGVLGDFRSAFVPKYWSK